MRASRIGWVAVAGACAVLCAGVLAFGGSDGHGHGVRISTAGDGDTVVFVGESGKAFLGVSVEEEIDNSAGGARVIEVVPDSPAAKAGVQAGDIIVGIDGRVIRGPRALTAALADREPGSSVTVEVLRDGGRTSVTAELSERGESGDFVWSGLGELRDGLEELHLEGLPMRFGLFGSARPKLGVQLADVTPELRQHLGGDGDAGVLISRVLPDTPAERAGLRVGDLIDAVDGEPVGDSGDLVRALADADGRRISIGLVRDGGWTTLDVDIPAREPDETSTGPRAWFVRPGSVGFGGESGAAAFERAQRAAERAQRAAGRTQRVTEQAVQRAMERVQRDAEQSQRETERLQRDAARAQRDAERTVERALRSRRATRSRMALQV